MDMNLGKPLEMGRGQSLACGSPYSLENEIRQQLNNNKSTTHQLKF